MGDITMNKVKEKFPYLLSTDGWYLPCPFCIRLGAQVTLACTMNNDQFLQVDNNIDLNKDNKGSLMSSLMGSNTEIDQDLFGEIPLQDDFRHELPSKGKIIVENPLDESPTHVPISNNPLAPNLHHVNPETRAPIIKSLLLTSGLLGSTLVAEGDDGLFDEVDREEAERQRQEEEKERLMREENERQRKEEEERIRMEKLRQEEEQRRWQSNHMMQSVTLSNSVYATHMPQPSIPMNNNVISQPQQIHQLTNQVNNMTMSAPTSMTFFERSQMMQQQAAMSQAVLSPQAQTTFPVSQNHNQGSDSFLPLGFYRPDPVLPSNLTSQPTATSTYVYSSTGGEVQTHVISPIPNPYMPTSVSRLPPTPTPSATVGMHNSAQLGRHAVRIPSIVQPSPFEPIYGAVKVNNPVLVQPPSLFNVTPPFWMYQIHTNLKEGGVWLVQRRFRHILCLETRLREECPGSILPPRPHKHSSRAIEEASTLQSAEFATQRCAEIEVYLNGLVRHPIAGKSHTLKLFLALQDDMGTAWPEISSNAITRFGAAVQNASDNSHMPWESYSQDSLEDDAELLALANSEGIRMGAVTQAVPKLEGSVALIRDHGDAAGSVGMELRKLSHTVEAFADRELSLPMEILSQGLLGFSRRQKRLVLELSAALHPFLLQYRMCRNEKWAFGDRRAALQKRVRERGRADQRAHQLIIHQRGYQQQAQYNGDGIGELDRLERDASQTDVMALSARQRCDLIGGIIKSEVNRIAYERRIDWNRSMKIVCSSMKEAAAEQVSIWESTRETFLQTFPEYNKPVVTSTNPNIK